jgi:glutathione S-transferase
MMMTLHHHPFCPHSRFVRIVLGEYGLAAQLAEERPWERRDAFLALNPAGTTPVLVEEDIPPIPGAGIIAEYLDEAYGAAVGDKRLMPEDTVGRSEVRRLTSWFNDKFFSEVSGLLAEERVYKRSMTSAQGGGEPNSGAIRAAHHNVHYHLAYIGWLLKSRSWLAGESMTYADVAAAAHLSLVDYLGDVPWSEDEGAQNWYARIKSRPSFRPILADTLPGVPPSRTYANLDF